MSTAPNRSGPTSNRARMARTDKLRTGESAPEMTTVVITNSDVAAHRDGSSPRGSATRFAFGRPDGVPTSRDPRGSPFQLPTRLADGLGLRSGLGSGSALPFAPSPFPRGVWFPRIGPQEGKANLGCNVSLHGAVFRTTRRVCQITGKAISQKR